MQKISIVNEIHFSDGKASLIDTSAFVDMDTATEYYLELCTRNMEIVVSEELSYLIDAGFYIDGDTLITLNVVDVNNN